MSKIWRFREDILSHYINSTSNNTFKDAQDRLNYLEKQEEHCIGCIYLDSCGYREDFLKSDCDDCSEFSYV